MIKKPLISIITAVYNGEKNLEETILSVINQTYDNVEFIIIDGSSTDGTIDIIKKYEDKIDYWISEKDSGIFDAMNKGILASKGDFINFMNAGDFFTRINLVSDVVNILNSEEINLLYGNHYTGNGNYYNGNIKYKNVQQGKYLGSYSTVPTGTVFASLIDEQKLTKNNMKGVYDFVLSGMHYGKPKSIDDQYYKEPWLSAGETYGTKGVTRDDVVLLYQKAKSEKSNYTFGNGNSIYACDIGVGNCTDYHSYFMSLDRTMGIPARFHMGFLIPSGGRGKVGGYHCWADYHVEGKGWYPVDISEADKNPDKKDYYFGTIDYDRVEMTNKVRKEYYMFIQ